MRLEGLGQLKNPPHRDSIPIITITQAKLNSWLNIHTEVHKEKCHKYPSLEVPKFPSTASHFSRLLKSNADGSVDDTGKISVQEALPVT
jgi:hypothetical protein